MASPIGTLEEEATVTCSPHLILLIGLGEELGGCKGGSALLAVR